MHPLRFLLNFRHRRVILHRPTKFHPNRTTHGGNAMSWRFSRWRPWSCKWISGFFCESTRLRSKSIRIPNFDEIHRSMYNDFRFRKRTAPYWNSTSGFDFDLISLPVSFCIGLTNFLEIELPACSYDVMSILKMVAIESLIYLGLRFQ